MPGFLWAIGHVILALHQVQATLRSSPVVGMVFLHDESKLQPANTFYAMKSYSKWLEQFNIRWIPLSMTDSPPVTERKLQAVDGLFFTGGNEPFFG